MGSTTLLVLVILTALAFDFTSGFHNTANAVATAVATGALRPRLASLGRAAAGHSLIDAFGVNGRGGAFAATILAAVLCVALFVMVAPAHR